ncbi:MAG: hypothetical protein IJZ19_10620, partial [Lentisphaeria bacterium]|nr:hypothetical protein [Lentisphaeria bacterium]
EPPTFPALISLPPVFIFEHPLKNENRTQKFFEKEGRGAGREEKTILQKCFFLSPRSLSIVLSSFILCG